MFQFINTAYIYSYTEIEINFIVGVKVKKNNWSVIKFRGDSVQKSFTIDEATKIAKILNIDFSKSKFDLEQFTMGINVELEHGLISLETNVTFNDPILTGKIALAHLNEFPDYYTRLKILEDEANKYWSNKK